MIAYGWKTLYHWAYWIAWYVPNRRNGWSHENLSSLRRIARKEGKSR